MFIACDFRVSLNEWILCLLFLLMIICDYLMKRWCLLFDMKDLLFKIWLDFINIDLCDFISLLYTEFLEKLPLTLKLINNVLIIFNLFMIIFNVSLNSWYYIRCVWSKLFFKRVSLSRMMMEVAINRLITIIIVLCLNTICMIHYYFIYFLTKICYFINGIKNIKILYYIW